MPESTDAFCPPARGNTQACHLFVYGSLVDPRRLDEVLGYKFAGERLRARLPGYQRVVSDNFGYPFIVERADHVVQGVLIMDLSQHDLDVLDLYEELQSGFYSRASVEVETWGCGPRPIFIRAETYVAGHVLLRLMASPAAQAAPSTAI
jgi:gamma-glutamylcyclotransferase (GGCT)/AIG2-like uncharacterized protein YtfP